MPVLIHNSPEFYFNLYLDNLYNTGLTKKICISTNANRCPLVPLDSGFDYVYTGSNQAVSISKTLDENPSEFGEIPINVIPNNVILSRQLHGTRFTLKMVTFNDLSPTETTVFNGVVGQITQTLQKVKIELVSDTEKLKTDERYKTSFSCMNTLGTGKCTLSTQAVDLTCTAITGANTFVTNFSGTLDANSQYEVIVGTTRYLLDKTQTSGGNLRVVGYLQGVPQRVRLQRHCNGTITQCTLYNNLAQFNGSVMLQTDAINVSL